MKKIILILIPVLLLSGCSLITPKNAAKKFSKDISQLDTYYLEGTMKITNNDDNYDYDLKVSYKKDDNYKVELTNKSNNYSQIILRNNEGVYVLNHLRTKLIKRSTFVDLFYLCYFIIIIL